MTSANDQVSPLARLKEDSAWTKDGIRSLRLRLGWSQSELARHLSCSTAEIVSLEDGKIFLSITMASELFRLKNCADACRDEVHASPMAEEVCEKRALGQIDFSEVEKDL